MEIQPSVPKPQLSCLWCPHLEGGPLPSSRLVWGQGVVGSQERTQVTRQHAAPQTVYRGRLGLTLEPDCLGSKPVPAPSNAALCGAISHSVIARLITKVEMTETVIVGVAMVLTG